MPGNPDQSPLLNYVVSFDGRMFEVFNSTEMDIWRRWISTLKTCKIPEHNEKLDSFDAMKNLVVRLGKTGFAEAAHAVIPIFGPADNGDPEERKPVLHWLTDSDPLVMMKALINPKNKYIQCGSKEKSLFYTSYTTERSSEMGVRYGRVAADAPELEGDPHCERIWTWRDILGRWIDDGCPLEEKKGYTFKLFPESGPSPAITVDRKGPCPFAIKAKVKALTSAVNPIDTLVSKPHVYKSGRHYIH